MFSAMSGATEHDEFEKARIMLGLLESVERDGAQTQRRLASELGIALGLVNSYLKRCIKKGLVKVSEAPARRYAYYLTPKGFGEKTRLTVDYLSYSFSLLRHARSDYSEVLSAARTRGCRRIVLAGVSDIAEVAAICAMNDGMRIVGVIDPKSTQTHIVGLPVLQQYEQLANSTPSSSPTSMQPGTPMPTRSSASVSIACLLRGFSTCPPAVRR
jgi:DNA-binding MarR family transcriptional regulator